MAAGGYDSKSALNPPPQGAIDAETAEENKNDSIFPPLDLNNNKPLKNSSRSKSKFSL